MVRYILLRKHLGAILPILLITNIAALAWNRTQKPARYGDLCNQYLPHPSEVCTYFSFPLTRTETGTPNRRHGSRHRNEVKNLLTQRERIKEARYHRPNPPHSSETSASLSSPLPQTETVTTNRRHGLRHNDYVKTFTTRRENIKEARPQRLITAGTKN